MAVVTLTLDVPDTLADYLNGLPASQRNNFAVSAFLQAQPHTSDLVEMAGETALLSEQALAEDWNRPEEDAAWSHLQPER